MRRLMPNELWQVAQLAARLDGALVQFEVAARRREAARWRHLCDRNAGWRDEVVGRLIRPQVRCASSSSLRRRAAAPPNSRSVGQARTAAHGLSAMPLMLAARRHAAAAAAAAATAQRQRVLARRRRARGGRRAHATLPALLSLLRLREHAAHERRGGRRQGGHGERSGAASSAAGENGLPHSSAAREGWLNHPATFNQT